MNTTKNNKKQSSLTSHLIAVAAATALSVLATQGALAQKKYDTGATDTEIKIGNVEAYSGPASAYGIIGKTEDAYFRMINDQGGINGRKITLSATTTATARRRRWNRSAS